MHDTSAGISLCSKGHCDSTECVWHEAEVLQHISPFLLHVPLYGRLIFVIHCRLQLLDVEFKLVQNGAECQKYSAHIRAWEDRRDSLGEGLGLSPNVVFSPPLFTPSTERSGPGTGGIHDCGSTPPMSSLEPIPL